MEYVAALVAGFLGSFHCIGMCGPIALALPVVGQGAMAKAASRLVYNIGRITTYAILGLLFGLVGKGLFIAGLQQGLSIAIGIVLLVMVLFVYLLKRKRKDIGLITKFTGKLKQQFARFFKSHSWAALYTLGLLNGLLPCGLVYIAIAGAVATGTPWGGATFMILFGLGTLPAMFLISSISGWLSAGVRRSMFRLVPVFVTVMAFFFIMRGMNLGIPYLSPKVSTTSETTLECCHPDH